ncbi:MAG TPA: hypothetical protein DEW39_02055 [Brevibacterium sp.]|uniref:Uncharacterized protein n=1 Tax=Brevibacterium antiquum CNRZ 918 TaxID=1255637 RepID=A0A2H1KTC6_9MICO|nr:hypothetical protein BANT918_02767 [Brevibacterium antiquum CNRZ 918]HCG54945.1 hypothetical protein [Brevibacterium sp.]
MREIRFFPDWGRKEPLWESDAYDYAVRGSDLSISPQLQADLRSYMRFWHEHFHEEDEWDSVLSKNHFSDEGSRLIRELSEQLKGCAVIVDERDEYARE